MKVKLTLKFFHIINALFLIKRKRKTRKEGENQKPPIPK
jgi:hypothetical protein